MYARKFENKDATEPSIPIDRNLRRFSVINRQRLSSLLEQLPPRHETLLRLITLSLHTNHPLLPGFVSPETPKGVAGYSPDSHTLAQARKEARSFDYKKRAYRELDIQAIFLMGSTGSVAQTANSDFDVWLCHRHNLSAEAVTAMAEKARAITSCAAGQGLEINFFLINPEKIRAGQLGSLTGESSGSAQFHLLLDEFYRTGLLLAGKAPAWWLVPPDREHEYDTFLKTAFGQRFAQADDYIDLGPVTGVPPREFIGAALWQLFKGVESPYKSILKILLLECYASDYPESRLLSAMYKDAVHAGETDTQSLDPYLLLLKRIEGHLQASGDEARLNLARQCLYLKAGLTYAAIQKSENPRALALRHEIASWGWPGERFTYLDSHSSWKIDDVLRERRSLVQAFMNSYRMLSAFARSNSEDSVISEHDLTVIGRKLFSAFDAKAGKLDRLSFTFGANLTESNLEISSWDTADNGQAWAVGRGGIDAAGQVQKAPILKRARSLCELMSWCYFNGLYDVNTRISIQPTAPGLNERDAVSLFQFLKMHFPSDPARRSSPEDFAQGARATTMALFVNLGGETSEIYGSPDRLLTSNRFDPLNFGSRKNNLISTLDLLVKTNWGEVLIFHFKTQQLLDVMVECLHWYKPNPETDELPEFLVYSVGLAQTPKKRMQDLFADVHRWHQRATPEFENNYVVEAGGQFHVLCQNGGEPFASVSGSRKKLLQTLGSGVAQFRETRIDPHSSLTTLALICTHNEQGKIQFFYSRRRDRAQVYVFDERGALFQTELPFFSEEALINQFNVFFLVVQYRRSANLSPNHSADRPTLEFCRIARDAQGWRIIPITLESTPKLPTTLNIKVIGETIDNKPVFTLFCDGTEFSSLEHGDRLFSVVADYIQAGRTSRNAYRVYITDIDLSRLQAEGAHGDGLHTSYYLAYKKIIEDRLNNA